MSDDRLFLLKDVNKKVIFVKDNAVVGVFNEEYEANGTIEYTVGKVMICTSKLSKIRMAAFFLDGKKEGFLSLDDDKDSVNMVVPMSIYDDINASFDTHYSVFTDEESGNEIKTKEEMEKYLSM